MTRITTRNSQGGVNGMQMQEFIFSQHNHVNKGCKDVFVVSLRDSLHVCFFVTLCRVNFLCNKVRFL